MSRVVIFGTGEFAQVAAIYLTADSPHEVVAFTVDGAHLQETELLGRPVVPFEDLAMRYPPTECDLFVAIGFSGLNRVRRAIYDRCKEAGYTLISHISSRAVHWGHIEVGDNCFIFENNVLQPFVKIGNNCVLWSGNHIGHHAQVGDNCFITSQVVISGGTTIGENCFVGVNATIGDHIRIGVNNVIGAGALILKDTEAGAAFLATPTETSRIPAERLPVFRARRAAG